MTIVPYVEDAALSRDASTRLRETRRRRRQFERTLKRSHRARWLRSRERSVRAWLMAAGFTFAWLAIPLSAFLALPGCATPDTVRSAIAGNADTAEWLRDELVPVLDGSKPFEQLTADERAALASALIANTWRARELQEWADDVPLDDGSERPE